MSLVVGRDEVEAQITVCDLTGIVVQQIRIAEAVCAAVQERRPDR